jgi:hypothetical protein
MKHAMIGSAWVAVALCACQPAPVGALDRWLTAYTKDDVDAVLANTYSGDRTLLKDALLELRHVPTGTLATALPPRPLEHKIVDVESKEDDGRRWIVLVKTKLKNPLPFMSKKVGHLLEDMPKTRDQRRRFLVVDEDGHWGVKLDLERVVARDAFAARFLGLLDQKKIDEAGALLVHVPPPPDEANALKKSDRLVDALKNELEKAKKTATRTSTKS